MKRKKRADYSEMTCWAAVPASHKNCLIHKTRGEVTSSGIGDAPILPDLLNQIAAGHDLWNITADGAYDTRKCHVAIAARNEHAVTPASKNAEIWKPDIPGARARHEAVRSSKYL